MPIIGLTKSRLLFIYIAIGTLVGLLIILFSLLPIAWILYCYIALLLGSISLIINNKKRYIQFLLIMTISVGRPFLVGEPFSEHFGGAQNVPEIFMSDIWLFILLLIWIGSLFQSEFSNKINIQYIEIACFIFIIWSIFSVINAGNYDYGFYELVRLIKQLILFFYIYRNTKTRDDVKFIVFCLMVVLCIQSCLAIFQYLGGAMPFGFFQEVSIEESTTNARRVGGTLNGSSALSEFLQLLTPLALALAYWGKDRFFHWSLFSLGTIALIFTFTRGAILSLILAIFLIVFIQIIYKRNNKLALILQTTLIMMIISTLFIVLKDEILLRFTVDDGGSAQARIPMMQVAFSIIRENPIFGIGLNNYNEVMCFYDMYVLLPSPIFAVHNVYLFFASEIGIPGLLILLYIIGVIYKKSYFIFKQNWDHLQYITFGIMIGITAYLLIHANVGMGFKYMVPIGNLLWLQFGLVVAIEKIIRTEKLS